MCQGTTPLEIQVRTYEMHRIAGYWRCRSLAVQGGRKEGWPFWERVGCCGKLVEWHRELSGAEEFLESVKTDIFMDQVFVYIPKDDIKDLPKGCHAAGFRLPRSLPTWAPLYRSKSKRTPCAGSTLISINGDVGRNYDGKGRKVRAGLVESGAGLCQHFSCPEKKSGNGSPSRTD